MKTKTTQKEIKATYNHVIAIGYCNLQYLLDYFTPQFYTVRKEGWGSDIYSFGNIAVSTGYAPFGDIRVDYDIVQKYNAIGEQLCYNSNLSWSERKKKAQNVIEQFLKESLTHR